MGIAPVYALVGKDLFLQLQSLRGVIDQLPAGTQRVDLDGASAGVADVFDELQSFGLFSAHKVVVVRNADDFLSSARATLEKYLGKPMQSATLILRFESLPRNQRVYKLIDSAGGIVDCEAPKQLDKWVSQHAQKHAVRLDSDAARLLVELVGNDLGRLDNELAKLALQYDGSSVGVEQVRSSATFQREQQMWDMTNALGAGDVAEALQRWRHMVQMDSSAEYRIFTWLTMMLESLRLCARRKQLGIGDFEIGKRVRIWDRSLLAKFLRTADQLQEPGVARATDLLAELDRGSKSGLGSADGNIERFIVEFGQML